MHRPAAARQFCRSSLGGEDSPIARVSLYRERFSDIGLYENGVYDGIARGADRARRDPATGCSSPPASRMSSPTASSTISACAVISSTCSAPNSTARASTSRDLLAYALKKPPVDPAKALMIGDRSHDMVGAKNNGMKGDRRALWLWQRGRTDRRPARSTSAPRRGRSWAAFPDNCAGGNSASQSSNAGTGVNLS